MAPDRKSPPPPTAPDPATHPASFRTASGREGGGSTLGRRSMLARLSVASDVAAELVLEVVEPPKQTHPVGPDAADIPLRPAEEADGAKLDLDSKDALSAMTHDADEDGVLRRGTVFSGVMHTITAVIGAGVLTLPSAMATLGYAGGSMALGLAAFVTLYTSQLLADLYVINGKRQRTYTGMVKTVLGGPSEIVIGIVQLGNLALTVVAYQVTAGKTLRAIARSLCGIDPVANAPVDAPRCFDTYWMYVLIFGGLQVVLSQAPSLESLAFASVVGAFASFGYSTIALALNIQNLPKGTWLGSARGMQTRLWSDLNAVGNILFAFSFSFMLLEIQDTLKGDGTARGPVLPMKKAVNISMAIMTVFYYAIAVTGYGTWGDTADNKFGKLLPDDVLTGYPGPKWAIILSNVLVMLHMIPAYQVWSQPVFECVKLSLENRMHKRGGWPRGLSERTFRLAFRTIYVVLTTFLACLVPFMGVILGLAGALGFWGASVWAPVECYIKVFTPRNGVKHSLRVLSTVCAIVAVACVVSGVQQLVVSASGFKLFQAGT